MKKILSAVIAASVAVCAAAGAFAAPQYNDRGNLIVESDINMDANAKKTTVRGSSKLDITSLFIWRSVGTQAVEKKLLITSEAGRIEEGTVHPFIPVDVSLRILNNSAKTKKKYIVGETSTADSGENDGKVSVFEYYTLTVSDDDGVVFEAQGIPSDATEIEIPLGTFNYDGENTTASKNYSDERKYTISLKEDKNLSKTDVTEYALPSKWKWYVDAKQQAYLVNGEATPTPKAANTPTPKATNAPVSTAEVTAPVDVEPETSAVPTVEPDTASSVRATATPRVRATSTPRASATPAASPKATSSAKASATATPKANPKTGDSAPVAGLSMLGIMALAAIAVIQVKKKNN